MSHPVSKCVFAWALALATAAPTMVARGQGLGPDFPALRKADAPAWLKEGVRLNYYSAVASVPNSMYYWSPNENGEWVSDDGKRWDRFDQPGAAGHGYTQLDVIAVEPPHVVLGLRAWSYHIISGPLVPGKRSSLIAAPGGGDWWIPPEVLGRVPEMLRTDPKTLEQFKIVRMDMKMIPTKKVFHVIRFQYERDKARHTVAYDTKTGLLVFKASMVEGPPQRFTKSNTLLSEMWFVDQRTMKLPWPAANLPDALKTGAAMRYEGTAKFETKSSSPFVLRLNADLTFTERGKRWVQYDQMTQVASPPGMPPTMPEQTKLVSGTLQLGGLWLAPDALRELKVGQVIDTDPITKEEIRVRDISAQSVTFTAASRAAGAEATYDRRSGYLIFGSASHTSDLVRQSTEIRLTRGPQ